MSLYEGTTSFRKPFHIIDRIYYGAVTDDSTTDIFEDDEALGSGVAATHYITVTPGWVTAIQIQRVNYMMDPTNAVTYQLHLLEDNPVNAVTESQFLIHSSAAARADGTYYFAAGDANGLPQDCYLGEPGRIYYKLDWTAAPGATTGVIAIRGRILSRI